MLSLMSITTRWFCLAFRLAPLLVLSALWVFPAYKHVYLGYLPVICGSLLALAIRARHPGGAVRHRPPNDLAFLTGLVLLTAAMQAAAVLVFRPQPLADGYYVLREAGRLLTTGRMNPVTYYAPAQIWYYAAFFRGFGATPLVAQLSQIPLGACLPLLVFFAGRVAIGPAAARGAALAVALYPSLVLYILVTPYYFYLYTFCWLLTLAAWLRLAAGGKPATAVWGGVAAGIGALAKSVLLLAPFQALLFLALAAGSFWRRRVWQSWLLFVCAMAATILPWTLRNWHVLGVPVPICTSGPMVLYSANHPDSNGLYHSRPDESMPANAQEMVAHAARCRRLAWAAIRHQPAAFLRRAGFKFLHTWGTETTFVELINRNGQPLQAAGLALRFVVQTGWAALVCAWAGMALRRLRTRAPPDILEIAAGLLVFSKFAVYVVYEGGARHHLPVVPMLILLVASGLATTSAREQGHAGH